MSARPVMTCIVASPQLPSGDHVDNFRRAGTDHDGIGVLPGQPLIDRDPGRAPVIAAIHALPAREVDACRHRASGHRARRCRPGRSRDDAPPLRVAPKDRRGPRDERARAVQHRTRRRTSAPTRTSGASTDQSRPPLRDARTPLSVASRRWLGSAGLMARAMAPLTKLPELIASQVAPPSRVRKSPPHALGSCARAAQGHSAMLRARSKASHRNGHQSRAATRLG